MRLWKHSNDKRLDYKEKRDENKNSGENSAKVLPLT